MIFDTAHCLWLIPTFIKTLNVVIDQSDVNFKWISQSRANE